MELSIFDMSMDFEDDMLEEYHSTCRQARTFKKRPDFMEELTEEEFVARFRLSKNTVRNLLSEIEQLIENPTKRSESVPSIVKLLVTLRFYATGSFLIVVGDFVGLHKSTVCRIVQHVTSVIASLCRKYIKMPTTNEEIQEAYLHFYRISAFPRVVGAINCTHVRIESPGGEKAEDYRNRKGYFSINVQTVSGADLKIKDIVARWPGSSHDSNIFSNSVLRSRFESGEFQNGVLLGDSGYPLKSYLITPVRNPTTRGEQLFNEAQIRTRNVVERQYGVWKRRFPVLGQCLRLKLETARSVILACAALHNIAIDAKDPIPPAPADDSFIAAANGVENVETVEEAQNNSRDFFINTFEKKL